MRKKKKRREKIIPFRQNLLGSIRPFLEPIQFFVLGASLSHGKPQKGGVSTRGQTPAKKLNLERSSQMRFIQGKLISVLVEI